MNILAEDPKAQSDARAGFEVGHIIEVSPGRDHGVFELESGERLPFTVREEGGGDAKELHVGDHAWVKKSETGETLRELVCPHRNKTLRVRLAVQT